MTRAIPRSGDLSEKTKAAPPRGDDPFAAMTDDAFVAALKLLPATLSPWEASFVVEVDVEMQQIVASEVAAPLTPEQVQQMILDLQARTGLPPVMQARVQAEILRLQTNPPCCVRGRLSPQSRAIGERILRGHTV